MIFVGWQLLNWSHTEIRIQYFCENWSRSQTFRNRNGVGVKKIQTPITSGQRWAWSRIGADPQSGYIFRIWIFGKKKNGIGARYRFGIMVWCKVYLSRDLFVRDPIVQLPAEMGTEPDLKSKIWRLNGFRSGFLASGSGFGINFSETAHLCLRFKPSHSSQIPSNFVLKLNPSNYDLKLNIQSRNTKLDGFWFQLAEQ